MADVDGGPGTASGGSTMTGQAGQVMTNQPAGSTDPREVVNAALARVLDRLQNDPAASMRSWNSGSKGASGAAAIDELDRTVAAMDRLNSIGTNRRGPRQIGAILSRRRGR